MGSGEVVGGADVNAVAQRIVLYFDSGGPVLALLALLSVFALTLVLLKLWQFTAARLYDRRTLTGALDQWRSGDPDGAVQRLERSRHVGAEVLVVAMRGRLAGSPEDEPRLREEITRIASNRLEALRGYFRGLELIGVLSPLLGLLGTVLGMIEAFRQLEAAGSRVDPSILSGGIWEALLTTAAGLALAIPAVALLSLLEQIVERFRSRLEDAVTQVFTVPLPVAASADAGAHEAMLAATTESAAGEPPVEAKEVAVGPATASAHLERLRDRRAAHAY